MFDVLEAMRVPRVLWSISVAIWLKYDDVPRKGGLTKPRRAESYVDHTCSRACVKTVTFRRIEPVFPVGLRVTPYPSRLRDSSRFVATYLELDRELPDRLSPWRTAGQIGAPARDEHRGAPCTPTLHGVACRRLPPIRRSLSHPSRRLHRLWLHSEHPHLAARS